MFNYIHTDIHDTTAVFRSANFSIKINADRILLKATVLQILLENHELCKYAKISLHIHKIVVKIKISL